MAHGFEVGLEHGISVVGEMLDLGEQHGCAVVGGRLPIRLGIEARSPREVNGRQRTHL
ncbi:hypothetical protein CBM2589_U10234 [Cupriavidus taiwanensis]|uniref:Uncharacterized protein n=1 Tax=Cupriavidus taiwanensis TaxID=164546 RepID=A0A375CQN4_9BURK|nr:hypothetical protein CBM2589_U10234 [Cupriavidus taiwanensis]